MTDKPTPEVAAMEPAFSVATEIEAAMRRSFAMGQTYWQQADSESYRQQDKSGQTLENFNAYVAERVGTLAAAVSAPAQPVAYMDREGLAISLQDLATKPKYIQEAWEQVKSEGRVTLLYAAPPAQPAAHAECREMVSCARCGLLVPSSDAAAQPADERSQQALTDEQIIAIGKNAFGIDPAFDGHLMKFARAIEAALRSQR